MITSKYIDISVAGLCYVTAMPNHTESFKNTGSGVETQFLYVLHGTAVFGPSDGVQDRVLVKGEVMDIEDLMGVPLTGSTAESFASWVGVNPKPSDKRFDYQLLHGGDSLAITGDSRERFLVALVGGVEANGTTIEQHKFARVKEGQQVNVQVPMSSVAIVLTTRQ